MSSASPVTPELGLRARKKQQTRQLIYEAASRLFAERGFDAVTVAEVARAADVSEVTVFNYFATKEDLFFGGMEFFEERLLEAVRQRSEGEAALMAFRRLVLENLDGLADPDRVSVIGRVASLIRRSEALQAREREVVARYTQRLADLLAEEAGLPPDDVEPAAVASALMGAHRAMVAYVRDQVAAGKRGRKLIADVRDQATRAFDRLDRGLAGYAVRARS